MVFLSGGRRLIVLFFFYYYTCCSLLHFEASTFNLLNLLNLPSIQLVIRLIDLIVASIHSIFSLVSIYFYRFSNVLRFYLCSSFATSSPSLVVCICLFCDILKDVVKRMHTAWLVACMNDKGTCSVFGTLYSVLDTISGRLLNYQLLLFINIWRLRILATLVINIFNIMEFVYSGKERERESKRVSVRELFVSWFKTIFVK